MTSPDVATVPTWYHFPGKTKPQEIHDGSVPLIGWGFEWNDKHYRVADVWRINNNWPSIGMAGTTHVFLEDVTGTDQDRLSTSPWWNQH